jgi:hypothetical protein
MTIGQSMQKTLAFLMTALLLLAGCTEPTEDSVADVIEEIIPGCNDETAYNYNESAGNDLACLSEEILIQAVNDFIKLMDEGPAAGETAGYTDTWSGPMNVEGEMMDADVLETAIFSPEGVYFESTIDLGPMMTLEEKWWAQPTSDGTMIYVDYNGEKFSMTSATSYEDVMKSIMDDDDMQDDETSGREDSSNEDAEPGIEPEELLQEADYDNSDSMSMEEFFVFLEELVLVERTDEMDKALESAYAEADEDQSGELTIDELNSFILSVDLIFEEMDEDTGEDEVFICDNGEEIPFGWVNDGDQDCSDGSDENGTNQYDVFICDNGEEIPFDWVDDGEQDCSDGSDENGDSEAGIDLSAYDFSSANFSLLMKPMDAVSTFVFSAEMTVFDSEIHTVTITVNALFEMRSIQVEIDSNDESGTFTLHTLDEMTAILEADMSSYASTEALPFTVEQDWSGNSFESMTYDEDGSPVFLTIFVCMEGVDATMIGNKSVMEVWNSTNLDTSSCDTEPLEYHMFAENETFALPEEFFINDFPENMSASSLSHNGTTMIETYYWPSSFSEECVYIGGTYDNSTSTCSESIGQITQSDSKAFELTHGENEQAVVTIYQYDSLTGSVLLLTPEDMFECETTGELISSEQWNDGIVDCSDGSDEPATEDSQFVDMWYCDAFMDTDVLAENEFLSVWNNTNLNMSMCDTDLGIDDLSNKEWNGPMNTTNVTIPNNISMMLQDAGVDDNEIWNIQFNGTHLSIPYTNWSNMGEECMGDYNQTTDICIEHLPLVNGDEEAFELSDPLNETQIIFYQYDGESGSGVFMYVLPMFECDSGEFIDSEFYEDGNEDCEDGSDESDWGWEDHSFSSVYDEITWELTGFKFSVYEDFESFKKVEFSIVAEEEYYTNENPDVKFLHSMGEETFSYDENGVLSVFYGITLLEEQADHEGYSYEDQCHVIIAMAYDSSDTMTGSYSEYVCFYDGNDDDMSVYTIMAGDAPFLFEGAAEDYSIVLSYCDTDYDEDGTEIRTCEEVDDVGLGLKDAMTSETDLRDEDYMDAMAEDGQYIFFVDADDSGTLSEGDMIYITNNGGVEESWNTVRLYSSSADAYSDENPSLPGFTGMLATLSLLGAAFIRRQEA